MPQFDPGTFVSQIFWLIVTFGVLYFLILPSFLKKLGSVRDERDDKIDGDLKACRGHEGRRRSDDGRV